MLNFTFTEAAKAAQDTELKLVRLSIEPDSWVAPKSYLCSVLLGNPATMGNETKSFEITVAQAQELQPIIQKWMKAEVLPDLKAVSPIEIKAEAEATK